MPDENDDKDKWLDRLIKLSPLILGLLFLIKIYGVAHFSARNAAQLISSAPSAVLIGTLVQYEGIVMASLTAASLWFVIFQWHSQGAQKRWIPVAVVIAIFTISLTPVVEISLTIVITILLVIPYFTISRYGIKIRTDPAAAAPVTITVTVAAALISIFILATIDTPWVPPQVIRFKPGSVSAVNSKVVAYILSEQNGKATLLLDGSRIVIKVPLDSIVTIEGCREEGLLKLGGEPLLWVLHGSNYNTSYISCHFLMP